MQTKYKQRSGADNVVSDVDALKARQLSALVNESSDIMELHTGDAFRMFIGRQGNGEVKAIIGGARVASSLRTIWTLSAKNNPYADWALVLYTQNIKSCMSTLNEKIKEIQDLIDESAKDGLKFSVIRAEEVKSVELRFKSPFGFGIAKMIVRFDYYARLVRTCMRKGIFSDDEGHELIGEFNRKVRREFAKTCLFEKHLQKKEMLEFSRRDYLDDATPAGKQRVEYATLHFGDIPNEIFTRKRVPTHGAHRVKISAEDMELLQNVVLNKLKKGEANDDEEVVLDHDESGLL
jgi:integrating conjugative element protein (TIGR03761 family)